MRPLHDPALLDALEKLSAAPFGGEAHRVTWATRDPIAGGVGGGRWHPPGEAEILYTSLSEQGALAEIYYHLSKAPLFSSSHMRISKLSIRTKRILTLDLPALAGLGVGEESFRKGAYARTREIGAAARFLDIEGLVVPSARSPATNLVLFMDRLAEPAGVTVLETRDVNWPAYREAKDGA